MVSARKIGTKCLLLATALMLLTIVPSQSFADTNSKKISFGFFDRFIEDLSELVTFDKIKKDKLRFQHAMAEQERVSQDIENGISIAKDRFERIKEKLENISEKTRGFIDQIRLLKEQNEIRQCISDFSKLRNISGQERSELAKQLDDKCNNLKSTQKYCTSRIDSALLSNENRPYQKLQEICPKLKDYSHNKASSLLYD